MEHNFKKGNIVICVDTGTKSLDWCCGDIHQIGLIESNNEYAMMEDLPNNQSGIWLDSLRLCTDIEISLYNNGIRNIFEAIETYEIF